jgi:hypothetical protein
MKTTLATLQNPFKREREQREREIDLFRKGKQGVCHTATLPFTLKSILMQKKNY